MKRLTSVLGSVILCPAMLAAAWAADWPQWRGPRRDGVMEGPQLPRSWPEKLSRVWSIPVGEGHSSPLLVGERVFLYSREGDQEVLRAVQLADGRIHWRESWAIPYTMHTAATGHGKGPKSTPAAWEGGIFTMGISGSLAAHEAETGRLRWRKEFSSQFKSTSPHYGTAASPLVDRGLVIAHVGGHHDGALTAFDARTGEARWSLKGDGPGYASPILTELGGRRQIITQTDRRIIGVAADTGRLLWSLPFTTPYDQNIVTPIISGELLIVSGMEQGLRAYAVEMKGEDQALKEVWNQPEASLYMSSPVLASGRLFGFSHLRRGHFVCLDPKSGQVLWSSPGRDGETASLIVAGDLLLGLTDAADLIALPTSTGAYAPLARYKVADSPTWAHPVPTPRGLLVKDKTNLSLWSWPT